MAQRSQWFMRVRPAAVFLGGVIVAGSFQTAIETSNNMSFCISCHEMRDTVYKEYQRTTHFSNRAGIQATCADCHVPRQWDLKVRRKIHATRELFHTMLGTVDTPEKFEDKRLEMAQRVLADMRANNSLECRGCHSIAQMESSRQRHQEAQAEGKTCIDCHSGIAHKDVSGNNEKYLNKNLIK